MAEKKSFAVKQNEEANRRKKAGQRLASDLVKNHIIPLGRWSDDLYERAFLTLISIVILDKLEVLLTAAKQRLSEGNLILVDHPIVIMNESEINEVINTLNLLAIDRGNIAAALLDFDALIKRGLDQLVSQEYIPEVEYTFRDEEQTECMIMLPRLTDFTPPKA